MLVGYSSVRPANKLSTHGLETLGIDIEDISEKTGSRVMHIRVQ